MKKTIVLLILAMTLLCLPSCMSVTMTVPQTADGQSDEAVAKEVDEDGMPSKQSAPAMTVSRVPKPVPS